MAPDRVVHVRRAARGSASYSDRQHRFVLFMLFFHLRALPFALKSDNIIGGALGASLVTVAGCDLARACGRSWA